MRAYYATRYGGPEHMTLGELPDPSPGEGEVLVRVHASSVNPVDWKVRSGIARPVSGLRFPKVLGTDLAGEVVGLGAGVSGLAPGQRVYGATSVMFGRPGAHAELVAVKADNLRVMPDTLGYEVAGVLPVAALTALNGFRLCGPLDGRRVLVNGATGGVGHFAVQVARARGAHVTAVCSAGNAELARELGAHEVIDYRSQDVLASAERWHVFFDAFGHVGAGPAARVVERGGCYACTLPGPGVMVRSLLNRLTGGPRVVMANLRAQPEDFAALEALLASGEVRAVVEHAFPLERAAEAFALSEKGGVRGKVRIDVAR